MKANIRQTIEFELGTVLHIERKIEGESIRGTSKIIGAHEPRYLLIDQPFALGKPMFSTAGENCVVRFLHNGTLLGFHAEIVKIYFDPFPIVVIEYPREIEEMALRKHDRLPCRFPALLKVDAPHDPELKAYLSRLSNPSKRAQGEGLAALVAEDVGDGALTPSEPLRATIVDLAPGGCQLGMAVLDPQNFTERALAARKDIPVSERSNYHARSLRLFCAKGRSAHLAFELPQPAPGRFLDVPCTLRWNKTFGDHFLLGVSFEGETPGLGESVQAIIEHQNKYFSRHYTPGG